MPSSPADLGLAPQPPQWALAAGLPEPEDGEGFARYVTRLGLDADWFFEDLTEQTAELAHLRLGSYLLAVHMPEVFQEHVHTLTLAHLDDNRRRELDWIRQTLPRR